MNTVTTTLNVVDHYEKDLSALVDENFKVLDAVLSFT